MAYELLLSPMKIGTMTVRNRTVMTAAEMSLGRTDGCPTEKLMDYYEERAKGGVGLIIPGICRVNDMGAASTFTQLSMSRDENIEPMRVFAERIHAHGAKLCLQLHHPGRQGYASSINTLPVVIPIVKRFPGVLDALFRCTPLLLGLEEKKICMSVQSPSNCELSAHGATRIHAMTRREIKHLIRDFVDAAERCQKAGVDAVELHGGHGYLIQQFLSPNTNRRTDEYGGDFEGRLRFLREIIEGIRGSQSVSKSWASTRSTSPAPATTSTTAGSSPHPTSPDGVRILQRRSRVSSPSPSSRSTSSAHPNRRSGSWKRDTRISSARRARLSAILTGSKRSPAGIQSRSAAASAACTASPRS